MTAYAAALLLLVAGALPSEVGGVYAKTSNEYKALVEKFVRKLNEMFWHVADSLTRTTHVKATYDTDLARLIVIVCDAAGKSEKHASFSGYNSDDFCQKTDVECVATIKQIFGDVAKKNGSTLPEGVFAKCSELKSSLGANNVANCI